MTDFDLINAYRKLVPTADRPLVEMRQKSLEKLSRGVPSIDRLSGLTRIAFSFPSTPDSETIKWFEKQVKETDKTFSVDIDIAEAARLASLVLRQRISVSDSRAALLVLSSSYCGTRVPVDVSLLQSARDLLTRNIRLAFPKISIQYEADESLPQPVELLTDPLTTASGKSAFEASKNRVDDSFERLSSSTYDALDEVSKYTKSLADEVDLLWWFIADWSSIEGRPRSSLSNIERAIVPSVEIGELIHEFPGPYGVHGILRRGLGGSHEEKCTLRSTIEALNAPQVQRLSSPVPPLFSGLLPIHAALQNRSERGGEWESAFEAGFAGVANVETSLFDLAVQCYRERLLLSHSRSQ